MPIKLKCIYIFFVIYCLITRCIKKICLPKRNKFFRNCLTLEVDTSNIICIENERLAHKMNELPHFLNHEFVKNDNLYWSGDFRVWKMRVLFESFSSTVQKLPFIQNIFPGDVVKTNWGVLLLFAHYLNESRILKRKINKIMKIMWCSPGFIITLLSEELFEK